MGIELMGVRWSEPYWFGPRFKVHADKIFLLTDASLSPLGVGATGEETTGRTVLSKLGIRYQRGMKILFQDITTDSECEVEECLDLLRELYELD